jgi:large subunit ribosomal protein L7/L12
MSSNRIEQLVNDIRALSLVECAELVKALETTFGVSAAMMSSGPAAGADAAKPAVEEKSEFKVELLEGGPDKIKTIKALREVKKELGLQEAKAAVENAPTLIAEAAAKDVAEQMKQKLEAVGAKVRLS